MREFNEELEKAILMSLFGSIKIREQAPRKYIVNAISFKRENIQECMKFCKNKLDYIYITKADMMAKLEVEGKFRPIFEGQYILKDSEGNFSIDDKKQAHLKEKEYAINACKFTKDNLDNCYTFSKGKFHSLIVIPSEHKATALVDTDRGTVGICEGEYMIKDKEGSIDIVTEKMWNMMKKKEML